LVLLLSLAAAVTPVRAADPPEVFGTIAFLKPYIDEPFRAGGGAGIRIPMFGRLAVRPEFVAASDHSFSHQYVLGSATYDFTGAPLAAVPYVVGGGGLLHERDKRISYSSNRAVLMGGAGIRFALGGRFYISPEFRAGRDAFPLVTIHLGIRLGNRR
jgi:hypothetical protein